MEVAELEETANAANAAGNYVEALQQLIAANRLDPDPEREIRIRDLRFTVDLSGKRTPAAHGNAPVTLSYQQEMPTCAIEDVTTDVVRAAFAERGCLYLPGAIDTEEAETLRLAVEEAQNACRSEEPDPRWFNRLKVPTKDDAFKLHNVRSWSQSAGGCLAADSPRAMFLICDMLERHGLVKLARDYLGEAPAFSAGKFMLWRVPPTDGEAGWHQDGRFLSDLADIESINVWTALTDCGETAPGMELVLEYLDHYVMPAQDSHFDWSVSDKQVDEFRQRVPVVTPKFKKGDMLIFDHWLLHRTSRLPHMSDTRYAIESWFFAPSAFPAGRFALRA